VGPHAVALARVAGACGLIPHLGADYLQVPTHRGPVPIVTEKFGAAARPAGLPVHAWTINEKSTMDTLHDVGVDGIMSDDIRLLLAVVRRREAKTQV
jgi:glycerophosphoryl diester phosphodiesterase